MKIAFIINFITHYRTTFYHKLSQSSEDEWVILHGLSDQNTGRPGFQGEIPYNNQVVGYREKSIGPFMVRYQEKVLETIRSIQPDVIIILGIPGTISNWSAMLWAKLHRKKSVLWYCGWEAQQGRGISLMIKRLVLRVFFGIADHIITYGTKAAQYAKDLGINNNKITVCYNGIEIDGLDRLESYYTQKAKELSRQRAITNQYVFLYVGGMMLEKKVDLLINAFSQVAKHHPAELWLVGDGPELNRLVALADSLKTKHVHFMVRIVDEVEIYFKAADSLILPGTGGLVLNQALYWGMPCVVGEADGTEDDLVIDGKTGFRFVPDDVKSLISAMEKCTTLTSQERLEFAQAGKQLITSRGNVNQMVKTFGEVMDGFRD